MEQNYKAKAVLGGMMRKNSAIKSSLGLEKRQNIVLDVMAKQGIKTDPSKLPGFKREKFLKAVTKEIGMGYDARKAFESAYGESKQASVAPKMDNKMAERQPANFQLKRNTPVIDNRRSLVQDFNASESALRANNTVIHGTSEAVIERLKNIQA